MNICQKERIFFFTHAITILSLFTYSVCDEKVKNNAGAGCHKLYVFVCVCVLQHHCRIHHTSPETMCLYIYIKRKCLSFF